MFDPNNQPPPHPGQMQTMSALSGMVQNQANPHFDQMMNALSGYGAARQDWRAQRPDNPGMGGDMGAFHTAMLDWRQARPSHMDYSNHPSGGPQTNPGFQGAPVPNTQFPVNPFAAPGVGQSLNVQGMIPAASGYGMPTY